MTKKSERKNWKNMCQEILDPLYGHVRLQHMDRNGEVWCYDRYDDIPERCSFYKNSDYGDEHQAWIEIAICVMTDKHNQILDLDFPHDFPKGTSWKKIHDTLCKYKNYKPWFRNENGLDMEMRSKHWRRITSQG